jgi:hypothetical protein
MLPRPVSADLPRAVVLSELLAVLRREPDLIYPPLRAFALPPQACRQSASAVFRDKPLNDRQEIRVEAGLGLYRHSFGHAIKSLGDAADDAGKCVAVATQ